MTSEKGASLFKRVALSVRIHIMRITFQKIAIIEASLQLQLLYKDRYVCMYVYVNNHIDRKVDILRSLYLYIFLSTFLSIPIYILFISLYNSLSPYISLSSIYVSFSEGFKTYFISHHLFFKTSFGC